MRSRVKTPFICLSILLVFSVGWNGSAGRLVAPLSMSLEGSRLFVSDGAAGVHVFDISDLAHPRHTLTIPLQGNRGAVAYGDVLYANDFDAIYAMRVASESYEILATIKQPRQEPRAIDGPVVERDNGGFGCACHTSTMSYDAAPAPAGGGVSSYATFVTVDTYLYFLDYTSIVTVDVSTPEAPKELSRTSISWTAETLFPSQSHLFVGGTQGMYIFDRARPDHPAQVGKIEHARACDPVVVEGETAYVTLRSGNNCGATPDELMAVDVAEPSSPHVIAHRPTKTPYGLAVGGELLYVSNGDHGFELVDVSDPADPVRRAAWSNAPTRDFIWSGDVLFVLSNRDLKIYNVSDPQNPTVIGAID